MEKLYTIFEIADLITKEKIGTLTDNENEKLQKWLSENERNKALYQKYDDGQLLVQELTKLKEIDSQKAFNKVAKRISFNKKPSVLMLVPNYLRYAAAVAVLLVSSYFIVTHFNKKETQHYAQNTFKPGFSNAILITANGQQIELQNTTKKQVISSVFATIVNIGSTLSYSEEQATTNETATVEYNELITPQGGEYTLVLADGSEVKLNAGSKLKFPVVFTGETREVILEGEAFFKVTKSDKMPFIVKTNELQVMVHGTQFNVLAYKNEHEVQTTLVEGSVGITINNNKTVGESKLKPGQQLTYNKTNETSETKEVTTDQFTAWTRGMFIFENEPIENILKVMSRWYTFEYQFKNQNLKDQRYTLSLNRFDNVNKILDLMSLSSNVKFVTKGNTIEVYPK